MKKFTAIILAALLTVSFAACNSSTVGSSSESQKRVPATESSVEEVQSEPEEESQASETVSQADEKAGEAEGEVTALAKMEEDAMGLTLYVKEAINTYKAGIETTKWNGKTASEATVKDVCIEDGIDYSSEYCERTIDSDTYIIYFINSKWEFKVYKSGEMVDGTVLTGDETIAELSESEDGLLAAMENDAKNLTMYVKEAVNVYRAEVETITYNDKSASEATVNDVFITNHIDYSENYYKRSIGEDSYTMFYNIANLQFEVRKSDEQGDDIIIVGSEKIVDLSHKNDESHQ